MGSLGDDLAERPCSCKVLLKLFRNPNQFWAMMESRFSTPAIFVAHGGGQS